MVERHVSTIGVIIVITVLGIVGYALYLNHHTWFPGVYSQHGVGVQNMLSFTKVVTGLVFIVGHLILAFIVLRFTFRRPASASAPNPRVERRLAWVPALIFALAAEGGALVLGLPVWGQYYGQPPQDAFRINVTGRQFNWVIHYPGEDNIFGRTNPELVSADNFLGLDPKDDSALDDIVMVNEMAVPVGRPILITLRSMDVIHSLFLPQFRVKQDAVPGMSIRIVFRPTQIGQFEMACNQICGLGHYRMRGFLYVMEDDKFRDWLSQQFTFGEFL